MSSNRFSAKVSIVLRLYEYISDVSVVFVYYLKCLWCLNGIELYFIGMFVVSGGVQVNYRTIEGWLLQSVEGELGHDGACYSIPLPSSSALMNNTRGFWTVLRLSRAREWHFTLCCFTIWRVHLIKADCRALFSTYSVIWTLNTFCQNSRYCPLSRHREFMFYCISRLVHLLSNRSR